MKITDTHVTRIELSADDVDVILSATADKLYRDRKISPAEPVPVPPWAAPSAPGLAPVSDWKSRTETLRQQDGGAVVTITRTR